MTRLQDELNNIDSQIANFQLRIHAVEFARQSRKAERERELELELGWISCCDHCRHHYCHCNCSCNRCSWHISKERFQILPKWMRRETAPCLDLSFNNFLDSDDEDINQLRRNRQIYENLRKNLTPSFNKVIMFKAKRTITADWCWNQDITYRILNTWTSLNNSDFTVFEFRNTDDCKAFDLRFGGEK